jgi:hypothetical protein
MVVNAGSVVRRKWEETLFRESLLTIVLVQADFLAA